MRLFAALALSEEATERLTRLRLRLCEPGDGLRWSTPDQWHITLQFYGSVDEDRAACLADGLAHLVVEGVPEVILNGLGWFAAKGILYASVELTPSLREIHQGLVEMGNSCGLCSESRAFRPHVTLARSKGRKGLATLQGLASPDLPSFGPEVRWKPREVALMRSALAPHGAVYSIETTAELQVHSTIRGG